MYVDKFDICRQIIFYLLILPDFYMFIRHHFCVFVFLLRQNNLRFLVVDKLDPSYADSLPSKPAFYCLSELLDTLRGNALQYHKHTRVMLKRLHRYVTIPVILSTVA